MDSAVGLGELDGIAQQVPDDLLQPRRVGKDWLPRPACIDQHLDRLLRQLAVEGIDGRLQKLGCMDRLQVQAQLAEVEARDIEKIGDEMRLRAGIALDRVEAALEAGILRMLQHLHPVENGIQRRAQFVRQHRHELVLGAADVLGGRPGRLLAFQQFFSLPQQRHAFRHVVRDGQADALLHMRRQAPVEMDQPAIGPQQREVSPPHPGPAGLGATTVPAPPA